MEDIIWKSFYLVMAFVTYFVFFFYFAEHFFSFLLFGIEDVLVLKEPQEYASLMFEFSLYFSYVFFLILLPVFLIIFFYNNFVQKEKNFFFFALTLYYYYILVSLIVVQKDLYTSSWDLFSLNKELFFDFQPNLTSIVLSYIWELNDFLFYIFTLFFLLFLTLKFKIKWWGHFWVKGIFLSFFLLSNIYFFGGDGRSHDIIVLFGSFFVFEFFTFCMIFFRNVTKFKI